MSNLVPCPFCGEEIHVDSMECIFCHRKVFGLLETPSKSKKAPSTQDRDQDQVICWFCNRRRADNSQSVNKKGSHNEIISVPRCKTCSGWHQATKNASIVFLPFLLILMTFFLNSPLLNGSFIQVGGLSILYQFIIVGMVGVMIYFALVAIGQNLLHIKPVSQSNAYSAAKDDLAKQDRQTTQK